MIERSNRQMDPRRVAHIRRQLKTRRLGYLPQWTFDEGPGHALAQVHARYVETIIQRLNQVPEKLKLAFLEFLGVELTPAQPARAPIVFRLSADASDTAAPGRTQIGAEAASDEEPDDGEAGRQVSGPIVFETERRLGLASARIQRVISLWPGRDQYVDHTSDFLEGNAIELFDRKRLRITDHELYLAHDRLLALAGNVRIELEFDLNEPGNRSLDIDWQFWDGEVWRHFRRHDAECLEGSQASADGTNGLQQSGRIVLESEYAEAAATAIAGQESFWIRGRLQQPLLPDPQHVLPQVRSITLSTTIERDLTITLSEPETLALKAAAEQSEDETKKTARLTLRDTNGHPLEEAELHFIADDNSLPIAVTDENGIANAVEFQRHPSLQLEVRYRGVQFRRSVLPPADDKVNRATLDPIFQIGGLQPDQAIGDNQQLELSEPFFPLGTQPQPGAAFYFCCAEALQKKNARLQVHLQRAKTPLDLLAVQVGGTVDPKKAGVKVEAIRAETIEQETITDADGRYSFAGLPAGEYQIKFSERSTPSDPFSLSSVSAWIVDSGKKSPEKPQKAPYDTHTPLEPRVNWEYWDGRDWKVLLRSSGDESGPKDFTASGFFQFVVPDDVEETEVQGTPALWIRARLISGGYGFRQTVRWQDADTTNDFTFIVNQPPTLSDIRLTYSWQDGPHAPQHAISHEDFQYTNRTAEAVQPGLTFPAFRRVADLLPSVLIALDKKLPSDRIGVLLQIAEANDGYRGAPMELEYWNGSNWKRLDAEDETNGLARTGIVSFLGAPDADRQSRFGDELYWFRARLQEDGPPPDSTVLAMHLNAVWASQRETILNQPLGSSNGLPNQVFTFPRIPVLDQELVEVKELQGKRANVQWRILLREALLDEALQTPDEQSESPESSQRLVEEALLETERRLREENWRSPVTHGPFRLIRGREKKVMGVWVRWTRRAHLLDSSSSDRHYKIDRASGRIFFGDGQQGSIPPLNATIRAGRFCTGGGASGNVAAGAISELLGGVGGVEEVFNPTPAEGGADGESIDAVAARGPRTLRHRDRAVSAMDYETMAIESSPNIAVARAASSIDPRGQRAAGRVTLTIIPHSKQQRPQPSVGLREAVRDYILQRVDSTLVSAERVQVVGPDYFPIGVNATIAPENPAAAGAVEKAVRAALLAFLHPLAGGSEKNGWTPGRSVYVSDVAAVLERVEGLDFVQELAITIDGVPQGESALVPTGHFVVAGELRIGFVRSRR